MTAENQDLYQAVLENIRESIPHFQPQASKSDWEPAARNAFKEAHPQMKLVQSISNTIGNINIDVHQLIQTIGSSGDTNIENICVICLSPRTTIWVFMPCRHANCCSACSQQIEEQGERCPVCRSVIETGFRKFN